MSPVERPKGGLASFEELNDRNHVSQPDASAGDFVELLKSLLAFRAEDRLSPEAALEHPFFSRNDSYGGPPDLSPPSLQAIPPQDEPLDLSTKLYRPLCSPVSD